MWHWFIFLIVVAVVTTVSVIAVVVWVVVAKKNTKTEPVIIELEPEPVVPVPEPEPVYSEPVDPEPVQPEPTPVEPPALPKNVVLIHDTFAFSSGGEALADHRPEYGSYSWIPSNYNALCKIDEATNALYLESLTEGKFSYIFSYFDPSVVNGFDPIHDTLIFNIDVRFYAVAMSSRNFEISGSIATTYDVNDVSFASYMFRCLTKIEHGQHTVRLILNRHGTEYAELDEVRCNLQMDVIYELTCTFQASGSTSLSFRDKSNPTMLNILLTGNTIPLSAEYQVCGAYLQSGAGDANHQMYVDTITVTATDAIVQPIAKLVFLDTFTSENEPLATHVSDSGHVWTKVGPANPWIEYNSMWVPIGAVAPGQAHFTMDTTEIGYQPALDTLTLQLKVQFAVTGALPEASSSISFTGTIKHSTGTPSHYFSCVFDVLTANAMASTYTPSLGNNQGTYTDRVATSAFNMTLDVSKTYMIEYSLTPDGFTTLSFGEMNSPTPFPRKIAITGQSNVLLAGTDTCEFSIEQPQTVDFKGHLLHLDTWTVTAHHA